MPSTQDHVATQKEAATALAAIRAERQPTRRGILLCAAAMAQMIRLGWDKDQLDALELVWWSVRDGNGEMLQRTSVERGNENHLAAPLSQTSSSVSVERDKKDLGKPGGV